MIGKLTPGDAFTVFPLRTLKHLLAAAAGASPEKAEVFAVLRYVCRPLVLVCRAPAQFAFQHPHEQDIHQQVGAI